MQKEKTVKSYQRKTKSGKVVTVKQHTAKYNAADMAKEALKKKHGAGKELEIKKNLIGTGVNGPVKKSPKTKDVLPIPEDKTKKRMSPKSKPLSTGVNGPIKKKSK